MVGIEINRNQAVFLKENRGAVKEVAIVKEHRIDDKPDDDKPKDKIGLGPE